MHDITSGSSPARSAGAARFLTHTGAALAVALLAAGAATAQSGGIYLPPPSGPLSGTAQAGSAAVARDAQTAWLNPAGMTRLESAEVLLSVMPFYLNAEFDPSSQTTASGTDGGNQGKWLPSGGLFLAAPLGEILAPPLAENVALGLSLTPLAGLALNPDDSWVARTWMTKIELLALNIEPSIGVRLSDQWSIGFGVDIQYVHFEQRLRGPLLGTKLDIDGDSWDVGFSVSTLWEPSETLRVGLRYRSEVKHDLDGDLEVRTGRPVSTSFTLPMSLTLSPYWDINEQFAVMADVGWTNWSAFDCNVITFDGTGASTELVRDWKDIWTVAIGGHFRPSKSWLIMLGGGYTSSAVDDAKRTPDIPVDEQARVATGLEYEINERWKVGANYTYLWLGKNDIDQTRPISGRVAGDYDAYAHIMGFYGSLSF